MGESQSWWVEKAAEALVICLGGLALSYVVDPWLSIGWWRCTLGIWVTRLSFIPWNSWSKP